MPIDPRTYPVVDRVAATSTGSCRPAAFRALPDRRDSSARCHDMRRRKACKGQLAALYSSNRTVSEAIESGAGFAGDAGRLQVSTPCTSCSRCRPIAWPHGG